jgi:REP element-mobilizing transposase RayT
MMVGRDRRARRDAKIMNLPKRKFLPHEVPSWVRSDRAIFFITIGCSPRCENQLCRPPVAKALFESVEFRQQRGDWWVHLFLLMPDHLHALACFPSDSEMSRVISSWKEFMAKKLGIRW